jgi:hypothetical protein
MLREEGQEEAKEESRPPTDSFSWFGRLKKHSWKNPFVDLMVLSHWCCWCSVVAVVEHWMVDDEAGWYWCYHHFAVDVVVAEHSIEVVAGMIVGNSSLG